MIFYQHHLQLLPTCRDSLHLIQERNWIPLLLGWLNLHDRPAVQIEALWALTNIAGLSSPSWTAPPPTTYFPNPSSSSNSSSSLNNGSFGGGSFPSSSSSPSEQVSSSQSQVDRNDMSSLSLNPGSFPQPAHMSHTGQTTTSTSTFSKFSSNFGSGFSASTTTTTSKKSLSSHSSISSRTAVLSSAVAMASAIPSSSTTNTPPMQPNSQSLSSCSVPSLNLSSTLQPPNSNTAAPSSHLLLRHPDAIPTLVSLLSSPNHEVHEQALWILGCVAAGDGGGVSNFPGSGGGTSSAPNPASASSSTVAAARETMLAAGVIPALVHCLETNLHNLSLQRIGSWALSNLVDGQFQQNGNGNKSGGGNSHSSTSNSFHSEIDAKLIMPTLRRLLHMADAEVLGHTCWTLSHLCDGPSSHIAAVVSPGGGLVPRLVDLLLHPSWRVTKPALRTIGNIVCAECVDDSTSVSHTATFTFGDCGDVSASPHIADYTEIILEYGAVPRLKELITHGHREIQKEACWTLYNIAAGTVDQIQAVIDCGAISPLVKLASDPNTDQEVRSEACWVVLNATSCGSDAQIEVLVSEGCVSVLGVLLGEASMVMMALEGLERVLQVEETKELARRASLDNASSEPDICKPVPTEADAASSSQQQRGSSVVSASLIEALEQHKNSAVSKRAGKIWKQHFVNCALCRQSFSRHRSTEARFCKECKCHVCSSCDCTVYHLSYQEELWAVSEEKSNNKNTTNNKKSKKQKKKDKKKGKKQNANNNASKNNSTQLEAASSSTPNGVKPRTLSGAEEDSVARSGSSGSSSSISASENRRPPVNELALQTSSNNKVATAPSANKSSAPEQQKNNQPLKKKKNTNSKKSSQKNGCSVPTDEEEELMDGYSKSNNQINKTNASSSKANKADYNDIDLVLYLQQTGSIIALAKLMDALDGDDTALLPCSQDGINSDYLNQCLRQHAETL